jgi:hypothetical protein
MAVQLESEVAPSAIFIHALFRTGSTYVWNKFRQLPHYVCYYEPFHQLLGGVTPDTVKNTLTLDYKAAGHPQLDKYYFYEYEALLQESTPGVPFFRKEISFDWFCLSAGDTNPYQKRYVDFLIQGAGNKIPLFQFNRTALRSGWFKSFYPGALNVYLYRNPRDQWQSYRAIEARTGFDKFFIMDLIALSKNRENTLIRPLAHAIPLLKFHSAIYTDEELFYQNLCHVYGEKEKYLIFYYLWLLSLLENALHADMLWDINALASDRTYRKKIQRWLAGKNIDAIDFGDCHITRYSDFQLPPDAMAEIEAHVQELIVGAYAKDQLEKIVRSLPPVMRNIFKRRGERNVIQRTKKSAHELQSDWLKTAEKLTAWIMDERLQKEKDSDDLHRELKNRDEQLSRSSDLLAHEFQKSEKRGQEIETLTDVLAEKEESISLLQDDLANKKQEIAAMTGSLVEKSESIALLQNKLHIMFRSYSFRIGKIVIYPLRVAKKIFMRLKGFSLPTALPRSVQSKWATMSSDEKKISVAGQIQLDFGRHRSGLKYGLQYLLGLHNPEGAVLDAFIERTFCWQPDRNSFYDKPWVGFIHVPPRTPEWFHPHQSNAAIFQSEQWQKSLPWCRGLFTFSRYHQQHLLKQLPLPVELLLLPSEAPRLTWSWEAFESNHQKKLIQVGWWLRKIHAIFQFPQTPFQKIFLNVGHPSLPEVIENEKKTLLHNGAFIDVNYNSVISVPFVSNREYDLLLSQNIVFMFLYNASACNAIVECMVRHTPLLINPLEAVVEYLGEGYPFYFESLAEAAAKLMNRDLICQTHEYLCSLPRQQELSGESFLRAFSGSGIYRSLAAPQAK